MNKKALMLICCFSVFAAIVCLPFFNSFAGKSKPKSHVPSVRPKRPFFNKCIRGKKFTINEDVYIKARKLIRNDSVDVYIIANKTWRFGTIITPFVAAEFNIPTDKKGRITCSLVWLAPLTEGFFDIVVDANKDGTFNQGDAVFGRSFKPGIKVIN